jgi:hypothetical protein
VGVELGTCGERDEVPTLLGVNQKNAIACGE